MIGYHYTTWENYQKIKRDGIKPTLLSEINQKEVGEVVKGSCIWVYVKEFTGLFLIGQIFYVSCKHNSTHIVCLKVSYPESDSATYLFKLENPMDKLCLKHKLGGIGLYNHKDAVYDLITKIVPPENIECVNSWNTLGILK